MFDGSFHRPRSAGALVRPGEIVAFWRAAGPDVWSSGSPVFDMSVRALFADAFAFAERGDLDGWEDMPEGALALVLLLDQYPRKAFRGTARMYATDAPARAAANEAIRRGFDLAVAPTLRAFLYLPFAHSEAEADQDWAVTLCDALGEPHAGRARERRALVAHFGRFPHRNAILGRSSTAEEAEWLAAGGYAG